MKRILRFIFCISSILFLMFSLKENIQGMEINNQVLIAKELWVPENNAEQSQKVIYLTFDDGPSVITSSILDILKEKDVKATFFLIGNQINGFEDVVKRINDEGHSIGLHTYSHNFKKIYCNKSSFINEMVDCQVEIVRATGSSTNIIRFPGGSRKLLSSELLNQLHGYNFKIYDWNMETKDVLNPKLPPDRLYREAVKKCEQTSNIFLLMHCDYMHINTCKALPRIIKYYKEQGYEFKAITEETPELYFPITRKTFNFSNIKR